MKNNYTKFEGRNPFSSQAKLVLHFDKMYQYLSRGDVDGPIFMEVGLTDKCNMECEWCITENGRDNQYGRSLEIGTLKKYLKDFSSLGGKAITYAGQGEPTYYKDFEEAVLYAKDVGFKLGLMTNGVYKKKYTELIGDNFEWIRISLDTINDSSYKEWKKVDGVKIVKRNIELLRGFPVKVGVNCNVGENITISHVKELIEWCEREPGVSYLQFRPVLPRYYKKDEVGYKKNGVVDINDEVWRYLLKSHSDDSFVNLSNDKRDDMANGTAFDFRSCEGHFFEPILTASGEVKVCTYHPENDDLGFGNVYENSFVEIWGSEKRKRAIEHVRKINYKKECQVCCKLSEPNKLIDFLLHPNEMEDVDFL